MTFVHKYRKAFAALGASLVTAAVWALSTGQDPTDPVTWLTVVAYVLVPPVAVATAPANGESPRFDTALVALAERAAPVAKVIAPALVNEAAGEALSAIQGHLRDRQGRLVGAVADDDVAVDDAVVSDSDDGTSEVEVVVPDSDAVAVDDAVPDSDVPTVSLSKD